MHDARFSNLATAPEPRPAKGAEDFAKALRRRWWLVLLVAILVGTGGTVFTIYQKPVYWASSRILIEPPKAIVPGLGEEVGGNAALFANFFNTRVQMITSRRIAERVLSALKLSDWDELNGVDDPVGELMGWIVVKPVKNSNLVDVGIEGGDSKLVAKIVNTTVNEFMRYEQESLQEFDQLSRRRIETELAGLASALSGAQRQLQTFHADHKDFLLDGQSVEAGRLAILEEAKVQAELRLDTAKRTVERLAALKESGAPWLSATSNERRRELHALLHQFDSELAYQKEVIRPERYESDVAIRRLRERRDEIAQSLQEVGKEDAVFEIERLKQEIQFAQMDLEHLEKLADSQRGDVLSQQDEQNMLTGLSAELDRLKSLSNLIAQRRLEIDMRQSLVTPRIQTIDRADVPTSPIRPIKVIQIPLFIVAGLVLGCMTVVGLEFFDRSIRVPEQALRSLEYPLLAVIPRLGRRELLRAGRRGQRGAPVPGPRAYEAFRSLRMGLVGAEAHGPVHSLLVASAGAGEGKSLIAANLAVTCARAGESVLLLDADLRKGSLADHFAIGSGAVGLIEVLEGHLPWQRGTYETGIDNLTLLPAGQAHNVPIDILGTLEMHDLIGKLAGCYDRVIVDGPALLGLADSRAVGRFVDGILLVVQSGARSDRPLRRVRQLCEHEGLRPVGIVFNGLRERHEDLTGYPYLSAA